MVQFKFLEAKAEYDFGKKTSEYKGDLKIGNAKLKLKHHLTTNCPKFELEGNLWEVGYDHKGRKLHAKKKWQLTKNLLFIVRQDFPNLNFGTFPSPELQLEHEIKNKGTIKKLKNELKYDMFYKTVTLEEELVFAKFYKLKGAYNTKTKMNGAKASLKAEYNKRFLDELELKVEKSKPLTMSYKFKPMHGLKVKAITDTKSRSVKGEIEAQFESDGMKVEIKQQVSASGWSQPVLELGYKF